MERAYAEKIIAIYNENNRWSYVRGTDLKKFLKNRLDAKIKSTTKKDELVKQAKELLTPETLPFFCEIDRFGLTVKDITDLFEISKYKASKIVNGGDISIVGVYTYSSNRYVSCYLYNIMDIIKYAQNNEIKKKKIQNIKVPEITQDNLAEALYILNKSAKKSRDTKKQAYEYCDYSVCNASKTRSMNLYHLKDVAMDKMIEDDYLTFVGIHRQIVNGKTVYLDLYRCGNFTYHRPHVGAVINKEKLMDTIIEDVISADITKNVNMKYTEAIKLLEVYTGEKSSGNFNNSRWKAY